jgi:ABC-2 type transport system ATP-binding protein
MTSAISVERFTKRYGDVLAVDDVSFEVRTGEVFALLGPNGAGKSTLVRALVGLHAPSSGVVRVAGFDLATQPIEAKERLGYIPETAQLYESLTAREHLTLVARLHRIPDSESPTKIGALLEMLDLGAAADSPIASYSKGMKQKAALAGALVSDPRVLILDEPMSGLDAEAALMVRALVREFASAGRAVLYTSHLLDVVEKVADRVAILVRGKLAALGTLDAIRASEGLRGDLAEVFAALVRSQDPNERAREILASVAKRSG